MTHRERTRRWHRLDSEWIGRDGRRLRRIRGGQTDVTVLNPADFVGSLLGPSGLDFNFPDLTNLLTGTDIAPPLFTAQIDGIPAITDLGLATTLPSSTAFGAGTPGGATIDFGAQTDQIVQAAGQVGGATGQQEAQAAVVQLRSTSDRVRDVVADIAPDGRTITLTDMNGNPATPDMLQRVKDWLSPLNDFLGSPIGKIVAAAGIGAATIGLIRGVTGDTATVQVPPQAPPNPIFGTTQQTLLNALGVPGATTTLTGAQNLGESLSGSLAGNAILADTLAQMAAQGQLNLTGAAPANQAIRTTALNQILTQMGYSPALLNALGLSGDVTGQAKSILAGGPAKPLTDPIQEGLATQIQNVLSGRYSNPQLEAQIRDERERLVETINQNWPGSLVLDKAGAVVGSTSTPGDQMLTRFDEQAMALREQDKRGVVASYLGPYQASRQFNITQPQSSQLSFLNSLFPQATTLANLGQGAQNTGLSQNVGLSQFGLTPPNQIMNTLSGIVPVPSLLGLSSAEAQQAQRNAQLFNAALVNAQNQAQQQAGLAQGIGSLGGILAGGLLNPPRQGLTLNLTG